MRTSLKTFAIVLGLVQLFCVLIIFAYPGKNFGSSLILLQYGNALLLWFFGLMFSTFLVWYRGHEGTIKKDMPALVVLALVTFASAFIYFVMIFNPFNR